MENCIHKEELKDSDEAWLVVDKDQWTDSQLTELHEWSEKKTNYGLAVSNPCFEYWLLLHFESGNKIESLQDIKQRLRKYIPNYDKGINKNHLCRDKVEQAIKHAEQRDNPPCKKWPCQSGITTVYKLVKRIFSD